MSPMLGLPDDVASFCVIIAFPMLSQSEEGVSNHSPDSVDLQGAPSGP